MLELGVALAQVSVTVIAADAIGACLWPRRIAVRHGALAWALQTAIGLLVLSSAIFILALARHATRAHLGTLFAALVLIALASFVRSVRQRRLRLRWIRDLGPSGRGLTLLGVVYGTWIVACATLPPTAVDELNHHLAVPRAVLREGGVVFLPDNIYAFFPPLGEMFFLFGLGVGGELAARLYHVIFGVVLGAALYGYSRRTLPPSMAAWPVILFFTVPSVMVILPWAYVDVMFALYAFLALVALLEFFDTRRLEWAALTGVMAAGVLATKYTGIQWLMLLVLAVLAEHLVTRRKTLPRAALVVAGIAVAWSLPVFVRNWWFTGWPLFPFPLGPLALDAAVNWDAERASMFLTLLATYGSGAEPLGPARLVDGLTAPLLVFVQARFNDPRLYDGVAGPVFLLTPLAVWRMTNRPAAVRMLAAIAVLFLWYWGLTIRQVRFLIPILPVLAVLLALGRQQCRSRIVTAAAGVCVLMSLAAGVWRVLEQRPLAFWRGSESREAYLSERLPVYAMYQAANRRLGSDARLYLINMRNLGYYLDPDWRADFVFEFHQLQRQLASNPAGDLAGFFRSREITHVLIDERLTFQPGVLSDDESAALRQFLDRQATVLEQIEGRTLYKLTGP